MRTIEELNEFLKEFDMEDCLYLSEEETVSAIVGFEDESRCLVYDYDKLVESFVEHFRKYDKEAKSDEELTDDAIEWIEYNTLRSLPYKQRDFIVHDDKNEVVESFNNYPDAEKKLNSLVGRGYIEEKEYKSPIIIHNIEQYGF